LAASNPAEAAAAAQRAQEKDATKKAAEKAKQRRQSRLPVLNVPPITIAPIITAAGAAAGGSTAAGGAAAAPTAPAGECTRRGVGRPRRETWLQRYEREESELNEKAREYAQLEADLMEDDVLDGGMVDEDEDDDCEGYEYQASVEAPTTSPTHAAAPEVHAATAPAMAPPAMNAARAPTLAPPTMHATTSTPSAMCAAAAPLTRHATTGPSAPPSSLGTAIHGATPKQVMGFGSTRGAVAVSRSRAPAAPPTQHPPRLAREVTIAASSLVALSEVANTCLDAERCAGNKRSSDVASLSKRANSGKARLSRGA
jgi:hypothetical protein